MCWEEFGLTLMFRLVLGEKHLYVEEMNTLMSTNRPLCPSSGDV